MKKISAWLSTLGFVVILSGPGCQTPTSPTSSNLPAELTSPLATLGEQGSAHRPTGNSTDTNIIILDVPDDATVQSAASLALPAGFSPEEGVVYDTSFREVARRGGASSEAALQRRPKRKGVGTVNVTPFSNKVTRLQPGWYFSAIINQVVIEGTGQANGGTLMAMTIRGDNPSACSNRTDGWVAYKYPTQAYGEIYFFGHIDEDCTATLSWDWVSEQFRPMEGVRGRGTVILEQVLGGIGMDIVNFDVPPESVAVLGRDGNVYSGTRSSHPHFEVDLLPSPAPRPGQKVEVEPKG